ncbi:MAG: hypothetical protein GY835_12260 [bacterium]|nr:hypothetical protein [bacterium]
MKFRSTAVILILLLAGGAEQALAETMAARGIITDGHSSEFTADEAVFTETEELNFDSWWGENNDINQIKATWDSDSLYVAVDGRIWNNNLMLFIDTDPLRGIENADELNSWARKLEFLHYRPEYLLATWDNNTLPQMWKLPVGFSRTIVELSPYVIPEEESYDPDIHATKDFCAGATFSQGQTGAAMEGAIPWTTFYPDLDEGTIPVDAEIALVAALVTGDDHKSGPDCAPNNLLGMTNNDGDICILDNFVILHVDRDLDGEPDLGVAPAGREGDHISENPPLTFLRDPRITGVTLELDRAEAIRAAFSPNGDGDADEAEIIFRASVDYRFSLNIYDPAGRRVRSLISRQDIAGGEDVTITWDGRDDDGLVVDAGIYLASLSLDLHDRINIPLAVVR